MGDGLGLGHVREGRVPLVAELGDLGRPTGQQFGEVPSAGAKHGVRHDPQAGLPDAVQVNHAGDVGEVWRLWVYVLQQALGLGIGQWHALGLLRSLSFCDMLLQFLHDLRRCASAVVGLVLEAVPLGRIVGWR